MLMHVAEFTLRAKPGHFAEVAALYTEFAAEFLAEHPALTTVLVVADEGRGVVRGIGVFQDRASADAVNEDPEFAAFNDAIEPLLAGPPERIELELLHLFNNG
jgi:quinol monooxygenase YgiN